MGEWRMTGPTVDAMTIMTALLNYVYHDNGSVRALTPLTFRREELGVGVATAFARSSEANIKNRQS